MTSITYSIVVPVFNSSHSIVELVNETHRVFEDIVKEPYEIILVDDCSPRAETWEVITELAVGNSRIKAFRLARNMGKPGALLCGLSMAQGDYIITMDDDLQQHPEHIPLLIQKRDHDVVVASYPQKKFGFFKRLVSDINSKCYEFLLGKPSHLMNTPYKLFKKHVVKAMLRIHTPRPFILGLILYVTDDIVNVTVPHNERKYGKSQYTLRKSFSLFSNMLFNNSSAMLRLMSIFGFSVALLSVMYGLYIIGRWFLLDSRVAGWTSLMVMLVAATGIILFCLGILGEYVARLIATAEHRPAFTIRESINNEEQIS